MKTDKLELMLEVARAYAKQATCPRLQGGAVIFNGDYHVVTSGYNGAPQGADHCLDVGCLLIDNHCVRACHSETNAVIQAARVGVSIEGCAMMATHFPCPWCARVVFQAGIYRVYYHDYVPGYDGEHQQFVMGMARRLNIDMIQFGVRS